MPSNRGKKRHKASGGGDDDEDSKWKSAELNMDIMKEFEMSGGLMIEEATEEVMVVRGVGGIATSLTKKGNEGQKRPAPDDEDDEHAEAKRRKKQKLKAKRKAQKAEAEKDSAEKAPSASPEELASENERLKRELAELKGDPAPAPAEPSAPPPEEEEVEVDLPYWREFDLHPALMKNIARLGFQKPSQVQARCLNPAIRQRKDIVGAAETGSGKTLAFGLPILHHTLCDSGASSSSSAQVSGDQEAAGEKDSRQLRALAILPTRELAVQVRKHLNDVCEGTGLRAECIVGGMASVKQRRLLNRHPQIVVGTPGRMFALLGLTPEAESERHDWLRDSLKGLRHLVLDEADRLVEAGHFRELDGILKLVYKSLARPQQLQTFVFSATLTLNPTSFKKRQQDNDTGKVEKLSERLQFREPRAVHIVDLNGPGGGLTGKAAAQQAANPAHAKTSLLPERLQLREAICTDDKDKEAVLTMWLLRRFRWEASDDAEQDRIVTHVNPDKKGSQIGGRIIIFANAISSVLRLTPLLALLLESPNADSVLAKVRLNQNKSKGNEHPGPSVQVLGLHSKMRQKDRLKKVERFRTSKHAVLMCTDVAARGLDVKDVAAVLHYQAPRNAETFVHRSGRTARAGREGESIALCGPGDHEQYQQLYKATGINKEERVSDVGSDAFQLSAAREAAKLAQELETKVHRLAKAMGDKSWMRKQAEEAELNFSDDEDEETRVKKDEDRRKLAGIWQQLQARVRRQPKRMGAGPMGQRRKR